MKLVAEMSPALRRYYRRSLWPLLCAPLLGFMHGRLGQDGPLWQRWAALLFGLALLLWLTLVYLRFLRECDELERKIELHALVAGACGCLLLLAGVQMLLGLGLATLTAGEAMLATALALLLPWLLLRAWLHRHYR